MTQGLNGRIAGLFALLIGANLASWAWALAAFHDYPVLLGTAVLAYSLGLRHALDADHIAEMGIRELVASGTTYFKGSSAARISRSVISLSRYSR